MCSRWPGHSCIQTAAGRHSVPHCSAQGNVNHHGEKGGGRQTERVTPDSVTLRLHTDV